MVETSYQVKKNKYFNLSFHFNIYSTRTPETRNNAEFYKDEIIYYEII